MSPKFESTVKPPEMPNNMGERMQAEALAVAFAVVGKMVAEGWLQINFADQDWPIVFRLQTQAVAEVLYDFQ